MSYSNWATQEAVNQFDSTIDEIFENCVENCASEDEALEEFSDTLCDFIETAIDSDLKNRGLDSILLDLASEISNIKYEEIFEACLSNDPDVFDRDDDESGEDDDLRM